MKFNKVTTAQDFNPVEIKLTFESLEEVQYFYWLTNTSAGSIKRENDCGNFDFSKVDKSSLDLFRFARDLLNNL